MHYFVNPHEHDRKVICYSKKNLEKHKMSFVQENDTYLANLKKYFKANELTDITIGDFFSRK